MTMHMRFVDLHCDTIVCQVFRAEDTKRLRYNPDGELDLLRMKEAGALLQCFALYIPPMDSLERFIEIKYGQAKDAWEFFNNAADCYERQMAANADLISPVLRYADIEENRARGLMSALLTVEDGVAIDGKTERVDAMHARGVRLITLTHNYENSIGFPNYGFRENGLKPFGIEAVRRMNELGVIIDVSHLSDAGFWDVAKHSKKPFVASHSNARALCPVVRNLTDDMLRALADAGGVAGLNFASDFLAEGSRHTYLADIARHARYMADKAGVEAIALGSDFDGISSVLEFPACAGMPMLEETLSRCFTAAEVDKITHENALRVIRDNIG